MGFVTLWNRFLAQGQNIGLEETKRIDTIWNQTFPCKIADSHKKCKAFYENSISLLNTLGGT